MKIECPSCKKAFDIPDERLPTDRQIAFPCPACKGTIEIDLRPDSQEDQASLSSTKRDDLEEGDALKKKILRTVGQLPPMPQTVLKAREVMASSSSNFKELGELLETDMAIAAKVLKLANSSYYGMGGKVSSIQHASVVLGHKTLGELVTMSGTSGLLSNTLEGYGLEAGELWRHSLGVAFGAKIISAKKNPSLANDAFAAGLLHDSGKIILDPYVLERNQQFIEFTAESDESFLTAEKQILGFDHSEIASEVCKSWNIPKSLTTAIRYHHYPSRSQEDELSHIVHMADGIAMMAGLGLGIDGMMYQFDDAAMEFLGLGEEDLTDIMGEVVQAVESISEQMQ